MNRNAIWRQLHAWVWIRFHSTYASPLEKWTLVLDNMQGGMFEIWYEKPPFNRNEGVSIEIEALVESGKELKFCQKKALELVIAKYNSELACEVQRQNRSRVIWLQRFTLRSRHGQSADSETTNTS